MTKDRTMSDVFMIKARVEEEDYLIHLHGIARPGHYYVHMSFGLFDHKVGLLLDEGACKELGLALETLAKWLEKERLRNAKTLK